MKRILFLLALVVSLSVTCIPAAAKSNNNASPKIEFKTTTHDFGTIKEADGKVTYEFVFTNKGNAPLIIISALAGCGCTDPQFDDKPIAPGQSSAIKVTYNPKGRPGEFVKNITIKTNDPKNKKLNIKIYGVVVPAKTPDKK